MYDLKYYCMGGEENGVGALARAPPVILEVACIIKKEGPRGVGAIVAHGAVLRLPASPPADNIGGELVMIHHMGNTGTVVLQWPEDLEVKRAGQLSRALIISTWDDRRVEDRGYWAREQLSKKRLGNGGKPRKRSPEK